MGIADVTYTTNVEEELPKLVRSGELTTTNITTETQYGGVRKTVDISKIATTKTINY